MAWTYLLLAGLFEIGWPVGLKISQQPETRWQGIAIAVVFMAISVFLLWLAQRSIPIGTAYAVWTGIGAAGGRIPGTHSACSSFNQVEIQIGGGDMVAIERGSMALTILNEEDRK